MGGLGAAAGSLHVLELGAVFVLVGPPRRRVGTGAAREVVARLERWLGGERWLEVAR